MSKSVRLKNDVYIDDSSIRVGTNGSLSIAGKLEYFDLNDLPSYRSGIFEIYATSNDPTSSVGMWWHVIQIMADDGGQWVYQEAVPWYGTFEKYARRKVAGTWENWTKVW